MLPKPLRAKRQGSKQPTAPPSVRDVKPLAPEQLPASPVLLTEHADSQLVKGDGSASDTLDVVDDSSEKSILVKGIIEDVKEEWNTKVKKKIGDIKTKLRRNSTIGCLKKRVGSSALNFGCIKTKARIGNEVPFRPIERLHTRLSLEERVSTANEFLEEITAQVLVGSSFMESSSVVRENLPTSPKLPIEPARNHTPPAPWSSASSSIYSPTPHMSPEVTSRRPPSPPLLRSSEEQGASLVQSNGSGRSRDGIRRGERKRASTWSSEAWAKDYMEFLEVHPAAIEENEGELEIVVRLRSAGPRSLATGKEGHNFEMIAGGGGGRLSGSSITAKQSDRLPLTVSVER